LFHAAIIPMDRQRPAATATGGALVAVVAVTALMTLTESAGVNPNAELRRALNEAVTEYAIFICGVWIQVISLRLSRF
jgi:hypothetical protein